MHTVDVVLLPDHLGSEQILNHTLIVVDVLRASTTIIAALESGAAVIVPVLGVDEAREVNQERAGSLLCGERGGEPPEGFVLGNSPLEYTKAIVGGQALVLTTTNGTRALSMVGDASKVLIGSITNREAVCQAARGSDVTIVCAGTLGSVSLDDSIAAGLMIERLIGMGEYEPTETASMVLRGTRSVIDEHGGMESGGILGALRSTAHGKRLIGLGMDADVECASRANSSAVVPVYDPETGEIRAS